MANVARQQNCCGVRELYALGGRSLEIIKQVHGWINGTYNAAFYMFADNVAAGNGKKLARYIAKHKLGHIAETSPTHNPQSNHKLQVWLWTIDKVAIDKFIADHNV